MMYSTSKTFTVSSVHCAEGWYLKLWPHLSLFSPQSCIQVNVSARQIPLLYVQEQFVFTLYCSWRCCASPLLEGLCMSLVTHVAFCSVAPLGITEQSASLCVSAVCLFVCIVHKLTCFCVWSINILMCNQLSSLWICLKSLPFFLCTL